MNALSTTNRDNEPHVVLELHNGEMCLPVGSGGFWGATVFPNKKEAMKHAHDLAIGEVFMDKWPMPVEIESCEEYRGEELGPGTPSYVIKCVPLIMGKRHYVE
jgi:hypothetical protein